MRKFINKILFIGLGGAGQRHLRIFRSLLPNTEFFAFRNINQTPTLNSDFTVNKKEKLEEIYNINIISDISDMKKIEPSLTIISVPNSLHYHYTKLAFEANSNVLVEKPGAISSDEANAVCDLFKNSNLIYKVGYQRQHHPFYKMIKKYLDLKILGNLEFVDVRVSSFIPNWHPYENYLDLYACRSSLGGGVLTTECHELNMIIDLFGRPSKTSFQFKNRSNEITQVADSTVGVLFYRDFEVNLNISFFRKPTNREIIFYFEKDIKLIWDLDNQKIIVNTNKESKHIIRSEIKSDDLFLFQALDTLKLDNSSNINYLNNLKIYTSILPEIE